MPENEIPENTEKKSEDTISDYYDDVKKQKMQDHEPGIKKARNALYATAALVLIGEVVSMARAGLEWSPLAIGIIAVEVGIFIGLALWTKTKPFTAIVTGLILFVAIWVLSIVISEQPVYAGIIVKAVIIFFLVSALKPAKDWEDLKKKG